MTAPVPTKTIDQKYQVRKALGAGGFGVVYLAEDAQLGREVAVKVLEAWSAPDAARFEREAKALSRLRHENIVEIFAYGRDEGGKPYIVMQYLEGRTLGNVLASEGRLEWQRAARIGIQVCEGLNYAHQLGIVHRDLKPDNIMLVDAHVAVKVLDFGLSSFLFDSPEAIQKLTQTGSVVGTAQYLSPEASVGQPADGRSDVYSLGCVLYQAMTGRMPFEAQDVLNVLYEHVNQLPPRFEKGLGIPEGVELAVFKALQKKADDRYQSMEEFRSALNTVLTNPASNTVNFASVKLPDKPKPKRGSKGVAIGVAALAVAAMGFVIPHLVPAEKQAAKYVGIDAWKHEQELGNLERERMHEDLAFQHFKTALSQAPGTQEKFTSDLSIAELTLYDCTNSDPELVNKALVDAYNIAPTHSDKLKAQTFLGLDAYKHGQYQRAVELLESEPWQVYEPAGPSFWNSHFSTLLSTCRVNLGMAYAHLPKPDREKAIHWLTLFQETFELTDTYDGGPNLVELAKLLIESGTPKRKAEGIRLLKETIAYTSPDSSSRKYAEETLAKLHQSSVNKPTLTEAQILAEAPALGIARESVVGASGGTLDSVYLQNQHWQSPRLNEALAQRYYLGSATTAETLSKQITASRELLAKVEPSSPAALIMRTCIGLGYADLGKYDQAKEFLEDRPWQNVERRIFDTEPKEAAADCLAAAYLQGKNPQPQKALDVLGAFAASGCQTARTNMWFGCALLMTGDEKRARGYLNYIMPMRYQELSRSELLFLKNTLAKHHMLDLWRT